jgi:hypothetical protein
VFISLAADALDEGGVSRDRLIPEEGLVERQEGKRSTTAL